MGSKEENPGKEFRIPLELKTVVKSLIIKKVWLIIIAVIAAGIGTGSALYFGTQKYRATTALYYQPIESLVADSFRIYQSVGEGTELTYEQNAGLIKSSANSDPLVNQKNMVKTTPNLEEVRKRLELDMTLDQLGTSIDVYIVSDSNLLFIEAVSESAETAYAIANTLRDVFLASSDRMIRANLLEQLNSLQLQYDQSLAELKVARSEFTNFITEYSIKDIEIESQKVAGELVDLELQLPAKQQDIDSLTKQIARIRENLLSAKGIRNRSITVEESSVDMYFDYTDDTAISDFIKLTQSRLLEKELLLIEAESSYESDLLRYGALQEQYRDMPEKRQRYSVLTGLAASLEAEVRGLEKVLSKLRLISDESYSDFAVISDAEIPLYPMDSNKKLIAIAAAALIGILGFTILLVIIVFDTRLKSSGDAFQKIQYHPLCEFPHEMDTAKLLPADGAVSLQIERYRMLAHSLRPAPRDAAAVYLITSTVHREGKSTAALNLATVFGRQDEHVLLLDAHVRSTPEDSPFIDFILTDGKPEDIKGLGEYLSYRVVDPEEIIMRTQLPGVDMILKRDNAIIPDLLQSSRMRELVDALKSKYSVIVIEGPPVHGCVDSEILAQYCTSVLYVAASDMAKPDIIRRGLERMEKTGVQIAGTILTKVRQPFVS